jgi:hypothetical protein
MEQTGGQRSLDDAESIKDWGSLQCLTVVLGVASQTEGVWAVQRGERTKKIEQRHVANSRTDNLECGKEIRRRVIAPAEDDVGAHLALLVALGALESSLLGFVGLSHCAIQGTRKAERRREAAIHRINLAQHAI